MIIRKITEYSEKYKVEKILLICDDKDEGWEMTSNELITLRDLIDKVYPSDEKHTDKLKNIDRTLEIKSLDSIIKNVAETFNLPAEILSNCADQFQKEAEIFKSFNRKTIAFEEECPDFIEPPEEIIATETPEQPKEAEKEISREQNYDFPRIKRVRRDYTKYIRMYRNGAEQKEIEERLVQDFGVAKSTATQIYYSKVKAEALKQIENEKVIIIDESKPAPGKFFTDAERERIQKAARIK